MNNHHIEYVPLPITAIYFGPKFGYGGASDEYKLYYLELKRHIIQNKIPTYVGILRPDDFSFKFIPINIEQLIDNEGCPLYNVWNDRGESLHV